MDKKKLKLSISGNPKKTISNIEQAKSGPKNSVVIKNNKGFQKKKFYKNSTTSEIHKKTNLGTGFKKSSGSFFPKKDISDFENKILQKCKSDKPEILDSISTSGKLEENAEKMLIDLINEFKKGLK